MGNAIYKGKIMQNKIIKLITIIGINCIAINAHASAAGFYMGLMLGPATSSASNQNVQTIATTTATPPKSSLGPIVIAKPETKQFGTRIFMGYQLNKYVGFEGGLDYFNGIAYKETLPPNTSATTFSVASSLQERFRGFDFVVKGIMPFGDYFDVYAKAGPMLVYQSISGGLNGSPSISSTGTVIAPKSKHTTQVRTTFTIGGSYYWNQNWVTDVSYTRILVGSVVNNISFLALGISYHFVDKYCGQFLCDD